MEDWWPEEIKELFYRIPNLESLDYRYSVKFTRSYLLSINNIQCLLVRKTSKEERNSMVVEMNLTIEDMKAIYATPFPLCAVKYKRKPKDS